MRTTIKTLMLATVFLASAMPAFSQTYPRPGREAAPEGYTTMQTNVTLNVPYVEGQAVDVQAEEALRTLYSLASRQCGIVLSTVATECRISNLTSTVNTQRMQRDFQQITVTAQISMIVKLK